MSNDRRVSLIPDGIATRAPKNRRWPLQSLIIMAVLPLLAIAVASLYGGVNSQLIMRDVTAVSNSHPLQGALSTLGLLVWSASAAIWLCTWVAASRAAQSDIAKFAIASCLLTGYMALDDAFLFHESLAQRYLMLPEKLVLAALGLVGLGYLFIFRSQLRSTPLFGLCVPALLGLSVVLDVAPQQIHDNMGPWQNFLEDGFKWLGITGWFGVSVFHFRNTL